MSSTILQHSVIDVPNIEPINADQQQQVVTETAHYIARAEAIFQRKFKVIPVLFDLRGKAAGMYVVSKRLGRVSRKIRYNPWLFSKYFTENLQDTVPHEVAHYIVDQLYGYGRRQKIRPHGVEWREVMAAFDADASVTSSFDLSGIPCREHQTFGYRCDCRDHQLTSRRHNKVLKNTATYQCRHCSGNLVPLLDRA